jgi:GAF domain-containing protein
MTEAGTRADSGGFEGVRPGGLESPAGEVMSQGRGPFLAEIELGGLEAGLKFLNARTDYRFTAIYRFEGDTMRNIYLFDRLGESVSNFAKVPLGDSFCQLALAEGGFYTANSSLDERVQGHPKQGVLNAYFGLPLSRKPGTIYGTFCHFDYKPLVLDDSEIEFLKSVTPWLLDYLE